jgi:hypothetical protein
MSALTGEEAAMDLSVSRMFDQCAQVYSPQFAK